MELVNYYTKTKRQEELPNPNYGRLHNISLPFRSLVVGSSGSGKSNYVLNLVNAIGSFEHIYLITRNADEPLYDFLVERAEDQITVIECNNDAVELPDIDGINVPPPKGSKQKRVIRNILFIFDDLVLSKAINNQIAEFYVRCRKKFISSIYLSQDFYRTPIVIRRNLTHLIIKQLSSRDLQTIVKDYSFGDISKETIKKMFKYCLKDSNLNAFVIEVATHPKFYVNFTPLNVADFN